jgi:hypothetical protein
MTRRRGKGGDLERLRHELVTPSGIRPVVDVVALAQNEGKGPAPRPPEAQRPADPRRPALAHRDLTPEEREQIQAMSRAGLVRRAKDNHVRDAVYREDKAGAECTCDATAGQVCALHAQLVGHRRHVRPG